MPAPLWRPCPAATLPPIPHQALLAEMALELFPRLAPLAAVAPAAGVDLAELAAVVAAAASPRESITAFNECLGSQAGCVRGLGAADSRLLRESQGCCVRPVAIMSPYCWGWGPAPQPTRPAHRQQPTWCPFGGPPIATGPAQIPAPCCC